MNVWTIEFLRGKLRKIWPGLPSTPAGFRHALGGAAIDVGRLTLATVLGYLLTIKLLPPPVDLTGALTALLVTQASLHGSFRAGMVRVSAVLTGIAVAMGVAAFVGLHWWSLALVVFAALMLARVLQLESGALEAAISAMLILGAAGADVAAQNRFLTTIIGTTVGIALPLLLPRRVVTTDLSRDLRRVASRLRQLHQQAARQLSAGQLSVSAADEWLTATRAITPLIAQSAGVLDEAAEVQKWNSRQIFRADVVPLLRHGLDALEGCLLATRHLFTAMQLAAIRIETDEDTGFGDDVRIQSGVVLAAIGEAIGAYEDLIEAEVSGEVIVAEARLDEALRRARTAQTDLVALMRVDPEQTERWLISGSVLSGLEQIIGELDLTGYTTHRDAWRSSQLGRVLPAGPIGPRIRSPWGLAAQHRLRKRAARSRSEHPEGSYEVSSDETTTLMPAASG